MSRFMPRLRRANAALVIWGGGDFGAGCRKRINTAVYPLCLPARWHLVNAELVAQGMPVVTFPPDVAQVDYLACKRRHGSRAGLGAV
ncbi:MAG: hypothetical protein H6668_06110 [Ardenticatenaceae bacterium]|nr:hypothetical protein [Ardenticatenaceae bacterium]